MSEYISNEILDAWKHQGWSLVGDRREKDGSTIYSMMSSGGLYRFMTLDQILNPPKQFGDMGPENVDETDPVTSW